MVGVTFDIFVNLRDLGIAAVHHQAQWLQFHRMGLRVSPREPKAGGWDAQRRMDCRVDRKVAKAGFNSLECPPNDPASLHFLYSSVAIEAEE